MIGAGIFLAIATGAMLYALGKADSLHPTQTEEDEAWDRRRE